MMDTRQQRPSARALSACVEALAARFGNRLVTSQAVRDQHAHTTTWLPRQPPDGVVFVQDTADVQDAVRICAKNRVPVIPYGVGTSLEGQVNAPLGGISLDFKDMNRVVEVHAEDLDCVVEPGVTRKQLNEHLRDSGLFFAIDPGADATLGGMAATRASGTNAVRYGTMRDNVLAMKVVGANGELITTGTRARKSAAGYDLTRLFIGSEGTLGVITELTLRLQGIPESIAAASCSFPSVEDACNATIATIQCGIPVARIELLDALQVKACNAYSKLSLPETPLLLLEFHGSEGEVKAQSERFGEIADGFGGGGFAWTTRPEERTKLWQARHDAYWAARALKVGGDAVSTDVCVPISKLAQCVTETQARSRAKAGCCRRSSAMSATATSTCCCSAILRDAEEIARAEGVLARLAARAHALGGTCTGEHGVGQGKRKYLEAELGPAALAAMAALKHALDPDDILNPGKILLVAVVSLS